MRFGFIALMIAMATSAPAYADGDSSSVPNPFTDQQNRSGNITSVDKGVGDFTGPIQNPDPQTPEPGNFGGTTGAQMSPENPPDSFYQNKRPGERRR